MLHVALFHRFYGATLYTFILGWFSPFLFIIFALEPLAALGAFFFGKANCSNGLKVTMWAGMTFLGCYRLHDYLTVGLESDADMFKLFFVYLPFLISLFILIGVGYRKLKK